MRVFITGGAGFIGSHLCDAFIANGDKVEILDNLSTGALKNISHIQSNISVINGDIRDKQLVESLVLKSDLVLHMAAAVGVHTILEKPIESISTNFAGSEIVLNACVKYRKKIVIASTSEIYGKNAHQPLSETDDRVMGSPQKLRWSYADSKALEEAMAHALFLANGLEVITLRFFNVVGPRQLGSYGMVLPRFVESALRNKPINVFGDGNQTRVFCHVLDVVRAIDLLVSNDITIGEYFNVGGFGEITMLELAKKIIVMTGSKSKIRFIDYSDAYAFGFEDMKRRVPDITKIFSAVKWQPILNLDDILKDVISSISTK